MLAMSLSLVLTPLRACPSAPAAPRRTTTTTRAILQSRPKVAMAQKKSTTTKKLSQSESVQEMSSIVAQAFGVGIALPVGIVSLLEASKKIPGVDSADIGLYGFVALTLGCGVWWVG